MKLSSDQREALDVILSTGEFETLCEHIEFLIERERAESQPSRKDYVAWCRYDHGGRQIKLCDSDAPGAFKVYRWPSERGGG